MDTNPDSSGKCDNNRQRKEPPPVTAQNGSNRYDIDNARHIRTIRYLYVIQYITAVSFARYKLLPPNYPDQRVLHPTTPKDCTSFPWTFGQRSS